MVFNEDSLDGRALDPVNRGPASRVGCVSEWHFRQSVLVNMRGAGELIFEHDSVDKGDLRGKDRLELRLASR